MRLATQGMATITMQQDVVSLLTADHEEVRALLKRLQEAKGQQAKRLFQEIEQALDIHTKVEEEIVYPAYRKCVGDKDAKVMVQESLTEHDLVDRVIAQMRGLQPSSVEFQGKATVLKELVEHHAKDEEKEMFPELRKKCSDERLHDLARKVERRKQELAGGAAAPSRQAPATNLSGATKDELYELAKERNIDGRSRMDKDELQRALGRR